MDTTDMVDFRFPRWRVKSIRFDLGMTQAQFAAAYHFSVSSVEAWEAGHYQPRNVSTIRALLQAERDAVIKIDPLAYRDECPRCYTFIAGSIAEHSVYCFPQEKGTGR